MKRVGDWARVLGTSLPLESKSERCSSGKNNSRARKRSAQVVRHGLVAGESPEPSDLLGRLQRCKKRGQITKKPCAGLFIVRTSSGNGWNSAVLLLTWDVEDTEKVASLVRRTPDRGTLMMARVVHISSSNRSLCSREARTGPPSCTVCNRWRRSG